jgi:hypothetical protein
LNLLNLIFCLFDGAESFFITSFAILLLFFLTFSPTSLFSVFLKLSKSIVWPVFFNPESFSYLVSILAEGFSTLLTSSFSIISFLVKSGSITLFTFVLGLFKSISPTFLNC